MGLPKSVQEAADAADAFMAQVNGAAPNLGEPAPTPQPQDPAVTPQPEPQPATPPVAEPRPVDWEHKYSTLKGMFDAEVPRLYTQNRELREQMDTLRRDVEAKPHTPPPEPQRLITDQDRENFGPDLVNMMERAAREVTAPLNAELQKLRDENAQLKSQVGTAQQTAAQTAESQFYAALRQAVPTVEAVNVDPGFMAWLQQVDPIYGIPRKMALDNAADRKDVARTAAIFNAYIATITPPQVAGKPAKELERQVTPARTRSSAAPEGKQPMLWTEASINRFYADCRRGAISTDEAVRLEADLNAAIAEGRVR